MARSDGSEEPGGLSGERTVVDGALGAVESLGVDAVLRLDDSGRVTGVLDEGALFEDGESVRGRRLPELVAAGGTEAARDAVRRVLDGDPVRERTVRLAGGGDRQWVELSADPVREAGEVVGARVAAREVTDRRRQGHSVDRRLVAMESALDGLAVLDANGEYVYLNEALADLYGYDREELRGRSWRDLYWPDERERLAEEALPSVERSGSWRGEAVGRRRDGSTFRQELSLASLPEGGLVCVVRDVTDRHRQEGVVELLDRVLRHNLRNEMNVVLGEAERIERLADGRVADAAGRIRTRARSLLETSETAREVRRSVAVDEPAGVADLDAVARRRCRELDDCDPSVDGVEGRLPVPDHGVDLAVRELLDNAVEHAGADPDVSVRLSRLGDDGTGRCRLRVADDGPGMPTMEREVLTGGERHPLRHGQGLGLWVVHWVVTEASGDISVADRDPSGTVVEVRLPLVERGALASQGTA